MPALMDLTVANGVNSIWTLMTHKLASSPDLSLFCLLGLRGCSTYTSHSVFPELKFPSSAHLQTSSPLPTSVTQATKCSSSLILHFPSPPNLICNQALSILPSNPLRCLWNPSTALHAQYYCSSLGQHSQPLDSQQVPPVLITSSPHPVFNPLSTLWPQSFSKITLITRPPCLKFLVAFKIKANPFNMAQRAPAYLSSLSLPTILSSVNPPATQTFSPSA